MTGTLEHKAHPSQPHTLSSRTACPELAAGSQRTILSLPKSVSALPHDQQKRKHGHTTKPIRNAGYGAKLKVNEL
jgi:hypothetical protein